MTTPSGPRLKRLRIKGYRSIDEWVEIDVPTASPLVLIGENNAGKSNILRALALVLGETWPGNHNPEDHEFYGRSPDGVEMRIHVGVEGMVCPKGCMTPITQIFWVFDKDADKPCEYTFEATGCSHTWMSNEVRSQLLVMTVGVERDLSWQLSYGSKWTTLSKLMRRFHALLVEDDGRVDKLKGFYTNLVDTFYEVDEFKDFADSLKAATSSFGGNLPYGLDIDFSAYDASNFFRSLRIYPHLEGEARAYEELGTGQAQVLAMAFSYAYAKAFGGEGLVLAVEEPEAHLHPLAQQWVAGKFEELAEEGVQVIITTHSPYFINLSKPGTTVVVRKTSEADSSTVVQLKPADLVRALRAYGAPSSITSTSVGAVYERAATNDLKAGLFARACVLVEGATEGLALAELLRRSGTDPVRLGVAVIPVDGINNLAKWVRFFRAHGQVVYPIFDTDSGKTGEAAVNAKNVRQEILGSLSLDSSLDWDDYVSGVVGVGDKFAVFDADFESAMESLFGDEYRDLAREARSDLGDAKPLVARHVARTLEGPDAGPSGWDDLRNLGAAIERVLRPPTDSSPVSAT